MPGPELLEDIDKKGETRLFYSVLVLFDKASFLKAFL